MVLFDLVTDDDEVPCGISRAALEQLGPSRCFRKEDALACFTRSRPLIERLAAAKLHARPAGQGGRLTLWADDIDLPPPPEGTVGLQQRSA
jgi:hypothetical protein